AGSSPHFGWSVSGPAMEQDSCRRPCCLGDLLRTTRPIFGEGKRAWSTACVNPLPNTLKGRLSRVRIRSSATSDKPLSVRLGSSPVQTHRRRVSPHPVQKPFPREIALHSCVRTGRSAGGCHTFNRWSREKCGSVTGGAVRAISGVPLCSREAVLQPGETGGAR